VTRFRHEVMPTIPTLDFLVLGLFLGPVLEESVFRGCLLPLLARLSQLRALFGFFVMIFVFKSCVFIMGM